MEAFDGAKRGRPIRRGFEGKPTPPILHQRTEPLGAAPISLSESPPASPPTCHWRYHRHVIVTDGSATYRTLQRNVTVAESPTPSGSSSSQRSRDDPAVLGSISNAAWAVEVCEPSIYARRVTKLSAIVTA